MATSDLGLVRDKITGLKLESGSASSGNVATYSLVTEMNPNGIGGFSVYNGKDGNFGLSYSPKFDVSNLLTQIQTYVSDVKNIIAFFRLDSTLMNIGEVCTPMYTFNDQNTSLASDLDSVSLYGTSGNAVALGTIQFLYYEDNSAIASSKVEGHFEATEYASLEQLFTASNSVDGIFIGRYQYDVYVVLKTGTHGQTGKRYYSFVSSKGYGTAVKSTSPTSYFSVHYDSLRYIDVGHNCADMNDALEAIYQEAIVDFSIFEKDIKLIAYLDNGGGLDTKEYPVTVIGFDNTNSMLIGYACDINSHEAYYFSATRTGQSDFQITKLGQEHLYLHHLTFSSLSDEYSFEIDIYNKSSVSMMGSYTSIPAGWYTASGWYSDSGGTQMFVNRARITQASDHYNIVLAGSTLSFSSTSAAMSVTTSVFTDTMTQIS